MQARVRAQGGLAAQQVVKYDHKAAQAADEFAVRRKARVDALTAEHEVVATEPIVIQTLVESLPLTDWSSERQ